MHLIATPKWNGLPERRWADVEAVSFFYDRAEPFVLIRRPSGERTLSLEHYSISVVRNPQPVPA